MAINIFESTREGQRDEGRWDSLGKSQEVPGKFPFLGKLSGDSKSTTENIQDFIISFSSTYVFILLFVYLFVCFVLAFSSLLRSFKCSVVISATFLLLSHQCLSSHPLFSHL